MDYLELMGGQAGWGARNLAYNLDFIPADKLNWKPAPTANSALEIVQHATRAFKFLQGMISGGSGEPPEVPLPTTAAEAKQQIIDAAVEYKQFLTTIDPATLTNQIPMPFGATFPLSRVVSMPVIDVIHHHGQIAYIQTLLGDTESHFDFALFQ